MSPAHPGRLLASPANRPQLIASPYGAISGRPNFPLDDPGTVAPRSGQTAPLSQVAGTPSPAGSATRPMMLGGPGYFPASSSVPSMLSPSNASASPATAPVPSHRAPASGSSAPITIGSNRDITDLHFGGSGGGGIGGSSSSGGSGAVAGGVVGERGEPTSHWQSQLREDARHAAALVEAAARHRSTTVSNPLGCDPHSSGVEKDAATSNQATPAPSESLGCVRRKGAVPCPVLLITEPPAYRIVPTCIHALITDK